MLEYKDKLKTVNGVKRVFFIHIYPISLVPKAIRFRRKLFLKNFGFRLQCCPL